MSAKLIQILKKTGTGSRARRTADIQSNVYGAWEGKFSDSYDINLSGYRLQIRTTTRGNIKKIERFFYDMGASAGFRDEFNRQAAGIHKGVQTMYQQGQTRQRLQDPESPPPLAGQFEQLAETQIVEIWENARISLSHDKNESGQLRDVFADDFEENLVVLPDAPDSYKQSFSQAL